MYAIRSYYEYKLNITKEAKKKLDEDLKQAHRKNHFHTRVRQNAAFPDLHL